MTRRLQHHKRASFSKVVKSIVTMENENKIIKERHWWLFKWGNFMSMVIGGKWGKVKGWCKKKKVERRKKLGMLVLRLRNKGKGLPSYVART